MDATNDASARRILNALKNAREKIEQLQQTDREAIAIIGIGCRFPGGVDSPESYWQLLSEGKDAVVEVPAQRWDSQRYYHPEANKLGFTNTTRAAILDHIDQFDPQFFNISPREAVNLDPQQRLVLETAWEALERAGQMPDRLAGTRAGVFVGITANDYSQLSDDIARYDAYFNSGNSLNVAAGRLSYTLGFTGPSMAVDTACSSSLTAVHLACQSLKQRECRLALAGGVNLMLLIQNSVALSQAGMLSPDGHCKTFDGS
ncbi:polyketide synthase, partial [Methylobacter sp.]|uniref:polyketide synthase n=1 Tax=Methylobacter sp. TaxID=2051955 RepID=UPI002FDDD5B5